MDLVLIATAIMLLAIAMYVILDGFDLGVGILFPFVRRDEDRDFMLQTIAPYWDGNETWLVLGGVTLFSAFPVAYSVLLPAWYLGIMVFLAALIFRGVVFEFRAQARRRWVWSIAFSVGSTLAAFAQGLVLGSFIQGFDVKNGHYAGGPFDWLTPFSLMTGVALVCGYALLGAGWLILKTRGELQDWSYRAAKPLLLVMIGFIVLVSIWTPLMQKEIADRWFSWPNIAWLSPVPLVTGVAAWRLWRSLHARKELEPFVLGITLFLLSFLGLGISLWPYAIPRHYTFWQAASPPESLKFILTGVVILLPLVLGYTIHTYRLFRGKTEPGDGYH